MVKFSTAWKGSSKGRKQRKYRYNAPLHVRQKFLHVHLSPELRKKYGFRNLQVRKNDKVKVVRGQFAKRDGKVERVDLKRERVYITGMESLKKDGTKMLAKFHPSNLMIIELNLDDKNRKEKLNSKNNNGNDAEKKDTKSAKLKSTENKK